MTVGMAHYLCEESIFEAMAEGGVLGSGFRGNDGLGNGAPTFEAMMGWVMQGH